ncbi:hypothetical protein UPYG_G00109720 [Umbra pygmaea]|uniref:Uncharacterized protein n=1 Tax=Umbra pygmaea TaxID=75934 RepID=A0ABD0X2M9_UMBPY
MTQKLVSLQGLLVAILYCFFNKEVQSEILKKWKRWKLGRNIEEEYRHTYSQPPHLNTKSGSVAGLGLSHGCRHHSPTSSLLHPCLPDIATTTTSAPHAKGPSCSSEEKHLLVVSCQNGMGRNRKNTGLTKHFHSPPCEGTIRCSHVLIDNNMDDICLTGKASECYEAPKENAESHL